MAKLMTLVKSSSQLDAQSFRSHWREYLEDVLAQPELRAAIQRVVHNHSVPLEIREDAEFAMGEWAGISEIWFDDRADAEVYLASEKLRAINAAHQSWLPAMASMLCHEIPMWDNGLERPTVKMIAFFHPSSTMTRAESQRYWHVDHVRVGGELMAPQRYAPRYLQNHAFLDYHAPDPKLDFAGAPELWFKSAAAAKELFGQSDKLERLAEDEAKFSTMDATVALVTDEEEMFVRGGVTQLAL